MSTPFARRWSSHTGAALGLRQRGIFQRLKEPRLYKTCMETALNHGTIVTLCPSNCKVVCRPIARLRASICKVCDVRLQCMWQTEWAEGIKCALGPHKICVDLPPGRVVRVHHPRLHLLLPRTCCQVLPPAVSKYDRDVAAIHTLSYALGAVQHRAGGDAGKDALLL